MEIDKTSFELSKSNYIDKKCDKRQIVLMDTHNHNMKHYKEWVAKNELGYYKTTPFTITATGQIYQHYEPENASVIFGIEDIDERIIPISIENVGWLEFSKEKNMFINWRGDIYYQEGNLFIKNWRNQQFWDWYTKEQVESIISLVNKLCDQFGINKRVQESNIYNEFIENFSGIAFKSNYSRISTDINPSMDFNYLSEKLNYEKR